MGVEERGGRAPVAWHVPRIRGDRQDLKTGKTCQQKARHRNTVSSFLSQTRPQTFTNPAPTSDLARRKRTADPELQPWRSIGNDRDSTFVSLDLSSFFAFRTSLLDTVQ